MVSTKHIKRFILSLSEIGVFVSFRVAFAEIHAQRREMRNSTTLTFRGLRTHIEKSLIDLNDIMSGEPGKDGIPAILNPKFVDA